MGANYGKFYCVGVYWLVNNPNIASYIDASEALPFPAKRVVFQNWMKFVVYKKSKSFLKPLLNLGRLLSILLSEMAVEQHNHNLFRYSIASSYVNGPSAFFPALISLSISFSSFAVFLFTASGAEEITRRSLTNSRR